jgi:pimeloyl-ACP methyl ester carboxylesterase
MASRLEPPDRRSALVLSAVFGALAVATVVTGVIAQRYQQAMARGRERATGSHVLRAEHGDIEYVVEGAGQAVLLVHGAGGGFDQGLLIGRTFVGPGHRVVAPSRFGYLRSSVPMDASPAAQADAYAALLDSLAIPRVAVVAFSDGGPSALQFALRHPGRTSALVMLAAKSESPPPESPLQSAVFGSIFRSDMVYWALSEAGRPFLLQMFGVSADVQERLDPEGQRLAAAVTEGMNPIGLRRAGIENDRATLSRLPPEQFPLEHIAAPTLVVHARDDNLQPFSHAENTAARVPGAELLAFDGGGHLLSLQTRAVRERVAAFIARFGS